jgi:GTPase SAR1 family protein
MGCLSSRDNSSNSSSKIDVVRDQRVQEQLAKQKSEIQLTARLLLLGTGESGKSTVFKQLKIIHKDAYPPEECMKFKDTIFTNVLQCIRALIEGCEKLEIAIDSPDVQTLATKIMAIPDETIVSSPATVLTPEMGQEIKKIWEDKGIKEAYERRSEFQLSDSAKYFLDKVETLVSPDYVPTRQDVVRSRVRTVGVVEAEFNIDKHIFKLIDVGGQRNERRKWIHVFDEVTAILFVTSLSEYDQKLVEDETMNRMKESLLLFDEMCNCRHFRQTPMIIFFNKMDFFEEKLKKVDLSVCFSDYTGGKNIEAAKKFISQKFMDLNKNKKNREVYSHFTTATETESIKNVFDNVKNVVISELMKNNQPM